MRARLEFGEGGSGFAVGRDCYAWIGEPRFSSFVIH